MLETQVELLKLIDKVQAETRQERTIILQAYEMARNLRNADSLPASTRRLKTAKLLKKLQDADPALYEQEMNKVESL